jgi:hypothetical protein
MSPRARKIVEHRLEDGEWKVIVRHADELPEKDSHQR